eukprot:354879-Chlamydomonas_euryale.AAC.2
MTYERPLQGHLSAARPKPLGTSVAGLPSGRPKVEQRVGKRAPGRRQNHPRVVRRGAGATATNPRLPLGGLKVTTPTPPTLGLPPGCRAVTSTCCSHGCQDSCAVQPRSDEAKLGARVVRCMRHGMIAHAAHVAWGVRWSCVQSFIRDQPGPRRSPNAVFCDLHTLSGAYTFISSHLTQHDGGNTSLLIDELAEAAVMPQSM